MLLIARCGSAAYFQLWCFKYLRTNNSRYFVKITGIWKPTPERYPGSVEMTWLLNPTCYYLGTYPNYWNIRYKRIELAGDEKRPDSFPMGSKPEIYGQYTPQFLNDELNDIEQTFGKDNLKKYFYPDTMKEDERTAFFETEFSPGWRILKAFEDAYFPQYRIFVETMMLEKWALEAQLKIYNDCIQKNWPVPPKIPKTIVKTPIGPAEWPGIPMDQLTLPTPTAPSAGPRKTPEQTLSLTVTFSIKDEVPYNAMDLSLSVIVL